MVTLRSIPTCVGLTPTALRAAHRAQVHPHVRGAHGEFRFHSSSWDGPSPRAWGSHQRSALLFRVPRSIPTCVGLTVNRCPVLVDDGGPSPRAWGSHPHVRGADAHERSIPTCVGLTRSPMRSYAITAVHPHVRGAHCPTRYAGTCHDGPSPRAWGSRGSGRGGWPRSRSIPTCVGLTPTALRAAHRAQVHPHVRGAHGEFRFHSSSWDGPSPRAWGSHQRSALLFRVPRSIPTCVGLTVNRCPVLVDDGGPSPRAWGSHPHVRGADAHERSIPTCVGLTRSPMRSYAITAVHPHVRGAHCPTRYAGTCHDGPSPRAWGSRRGVEARRRRHRSIPTCVGLTRQPSPARSRSTVHPHVRGAHGERIRGSTVRVGPSPRAWGSLEQPLVFGVVGRSIPTCVGLTVRAAFLTQDEAVHPHVRGAHTRGRVVSSGERGPSPRAWGSRSGPRGRECRWRSIPTCVGLTHPGTRGSHLRAVHPHVRGAHSSQPPTENSPNGPSPRAWGSRSGGTWGLSGLRSIPTCVGLTLLDGAAAHEDSGPSPRAWGSRYAGGGAGDELRSIPTCVGLTVACCWLVTEVPVHPHVRGAHSGAACSSPAAVGPSPRAWGSRPDLSGTGLTCTVHPHVRGAH